MTTMTIMIFKSTFSSLKRNVKLCCTCYRRTTRMSEAPYREKPMNGVNCCAKKKHMFFTVAAATTASASPAVPVAAPPPYASASTVERRSTLWPTQRCLPASALLQPTSCCGQWHHDHCWWRGIGAADGDECQAQAR